MDFRITKHFKFSEFECKDGSKYPFKWVDSRLVNLCKNLEVLRKRLADKYKCKLSIKITCGYRTPEYNEHLRSIMKGVAKFSQHVQGKAADIRVICKQKNITPTMIYDTIEELIKENKIYNGGLSKYSSFVHYDIREKPERW